MHSSLLQLPESSWIASNELAFAGPAPPIAPPPSPSELDALCVVDIFNEGVDLRSIAGTPGRGHEGK